MSVSRWALRGTGLFLAAAGALIWGLSIRENGTRADSDAQRLFGALGTDEDESAQDASALLELSHASRAVRAAFLWEGLQSEAPADKLRLHDQGVSVALSQVDSSEAAALYQAAIRPALEGSPAPKILRECFALLSRWSLISQISSRDAAEIASRLADRIPAERETGTLELFSAAIADLAPRLSPESAASLGTKLFDLAMSGNDPGEVRASTQAFIAVVPQLTADRRRELASALVARIAAERRRSVILVLSPALAPLSETLSPKVSGELANALATRIAADWDPESLGALISAFRAVAPKVDPADAQRIAAPLLQHVSLEPDASVLLMVTQALAAFGDKLPRRTYEQAGQAVLQRFQSERNAGTLYVLAASLGVLKDKASADQFAEASSQIVARFAGEHDLQTISSLAAAIDPVADDLDPGVAERLSTTLVARMVEEHDAGSLFYLGVGLQPIADEVTGPGAAALVARLTGRMRPERRPSVLRTLAFSAGAFKHTSGNFEAAAELLIARMADENDPAELRALTSGLYALREKTSAGSFEKAASILAARIQAQSDPSAIRALAVSLHALSGKSGAEPFERAASAILANVNNLAALEPALQRVADKLRPEKAQELSKALAEGITREQDPRTLRVLGQVLADLPVRSDPLNLGPILAIPQAPCNASHSAAQLLNPLCSEAAWSELAAGVVHAKTQPANDLEPDFTQLAPDDDDVAPGPSEEQPPLDFHQVSDAVEGLRPAPQSVKRPDWTRWSAITLLISGVLVLLYSSRQ